MITSVNSGTKKRIFLSAAEASGDKLCAELIKAFKKTGRDFEFVGIGGEQMAKAGCQILENPTKNAAMTYNAFTQIGFYIGLISRISRYFKSNKVDLVIVCDSPAFNFHVAKSAKKSGIKTLFYVAPQLWAWAPWRIKKLKYCCDKLLCLLPFEQDWFRQRGVDCEFVGHPWFDAGTFTPAKKRSYDKFEPNKTTIALLPGSRKAEIETLWKPMQQVAIELQKLWPGMKFTAVASDAEKLKLLQAMQIQGFKCELGVDCLPETVAKADFALVASGSATLQVAAAGCPMVVMYQSSRIMWWLVGKWLVKLKLFSLVNILAGRELAPEFMPYFSSIEPIVESCQLLLGDEDMMNHLSSQLTKTVQPLAKGNTSERVAQIAVEMIG